ncbi:tRNA (adenosine(37)-N6)-threonylcarbamoyltransferase complex dimerization subunit type 1 TsaB [Sporolactobacillus shoreicorticis]|uniref:tRNA (Adenosine(37)-N6)-threonylcarbamoyltransferase complex dimerization subunit type 1 TsaB n=1 Tax=Sporolactobacillus shoreicorticis TaxID=1923877 RepID=A0ABW5S047_9BACL|nr:tRNA (adenosine(37)-N6)-threonylcarbamoyltransferase complex dimerization subunit type 1 TsaB [Sporolactobacillus shoreicorticis]MCO7128008.1 tRNA (adenosine(37)-N6)-threonylcarbamoyltransferase complex dimerization subunit type 1 TsaB [Sporolactobacillus shoreicorticis]
MNVLAIDSSNLVMSVAVTTERKVLAELTTNSRKNHSERLMPAIAQMIEAAGLEAADIDRIAVAEGPGSYTGLRIGATIAKMLAWTLKKDLVGVSSLEVAAQNGRGFAGYIAPFFDARRGQVFTGLYEAKDGEIVSVAPDQLVMMDDWLPELRNLAEPVLFLSNDLDKWGELLSTQAYAELGDITRNVPRAAELARIGAKKEPVSDIHHFLPAYLRLAEAEAKWLAKQGR